MTVKPTTAKPATQQEVDDLATGNAQEEIIPYTVAFDVDGCLRNSKVDQNAKPVPNEDVRELLVFLSRFTNVLIHVWSGSGEYYAREVASHFGLAGYIDSYSSKTEQVTKKGNLATGNDGFKVDVAVDDVPTTKLGKLNIITGEEYVFNLPATGATTNIPPAVPTPQAPPKGKNPKVLTVAFDVDGTLLEHGTDNWENPKPREDIRAVLLYLSRCRNVLIHLWSGQGVEHAKTVAQKIGIFNYVDSYSAKGDKVRKDGEVVQTSNGFHPDIAVDDLLNTQLATVNFVVGPEFYP